MHECDEKLNFLVPREMAEAKICRMKIFLISGLIVIEPSNDLGIERAESW